MAMAKIPCEWVGAAGLPGFTTFYCEIATQNPTPALRQFFADIAGLIPDSINVTVAASGDIISPSNGQLTGTWSFTPTAAVAGTGTGVYAAPVGMGVNWVTGEIVEGRRVRGRSYIVPCVSSVFFSDGTPTSANIALLDAAAEALITALSPDLKVWSRPVFEGDPPVLIRSGSDNEVTSATVPDKGYVLTSRRD